MSGKQKAPPACKACGAPILWAQSANGKSVMLDKARDLSGTSLHAVRRDVNLSVHVRILGQGEQPIAGVEHRHQPHYATCPERQKAARDD